MAIIVFWLLVHLLNRLLEPRFSVLGTVIGSLNAFLLLTISLIMLIVFNISSDYIFVGTATTVIYIYALIFRKGELLVKLFWILTFLAFFIISYVAANALKLSLFNEVDNTNIPYWAIIVFSLIIIILMSYLLRPITRKKMLLVKMSPKVMIVHTLILVTSCAILIMISEFVAGSTMYAQTPTLLLFLVSSGIGIIVYCSFSSYRYMSSQTKRDLKQQALLQRAALEKVHLDEVSSLYNATREWRHEYSNNMQIIRGYVEAEKYDDLRKYLSVLDTSLDKISYRFKVGDELISAILNAKAARADKAGIKLTVTWKVSSIEPHFELTDIASLIGNILDNAIEACQRIEKQETPPEIIVQISQSESDLKVYEKNPTDGNVVVVDGVPKSSKKEPGHGIGSTLIQAVAEKYNGYVDFKITESEFELFVLLRNER